METNTLYTLARENGVTVDFFPLPLCKSACVNVDGRDFVALDSTVRGSEERVYLAHELGHCLSAAFYNLHSPLSSRGKAENKAKAWAIKTLVPIADLKKAMANGVCDTENLADHFGVTEALMEQALSYYSNK